jgi:SAM-dependent methyltransferase
MTPGKGDGGKRQPVSQTEFDRYAVGYRDTVNDAVGIAGVDVDQLAGYKARLLLGLVEQRLGDPGACKVLDVGCGIGLVAAELAAGVSELHGIDTSERSVRQAARAVPAARFQHFAGDRIPHADEAFDLVFADCILHHVPPPTRAAFVREMARVTRPGGLLALIEHNPLNPATRYMVSRCAFDGDAVRLGPATGARLLAGAGLEPGGHPYVAVSPWRSAFVERVEQRLGWRPAGAQYYIWATKGPSRCQDPSRRAPGRRG